MRGAVTGDGRMMSAITAAAVAKKQAMRATLEAGKRRCPRCGRTLPLSAFGRAPTPSGLSGWCRACHAEDARHRAAVARELARPAGVRPPRSFGLRCCGGWLEWDTALSWWLCRHGRGCRDRWQPGTGGLVRRDEALPGRAKPSHAEP